MKYAFSVDLADWDRTEPPRGFHCKAKAPFVMNSNGIAVDPTGLVYKYGGSIMSGVYDTVEQAVGRFAEMVESCSPAVTHRTFVQLMIEDERFTSDANIERAALFFKDRMTLAKFPNKIRNPYISVWDVQDEEFSTVFERYRRELRYQQWGKALSVKSFRKNRGAVNMRLGRGILEFRWFAPTVDPKQLHACFYLASCLLEEALVPEYQTITELVHELDLRLPAYPVFSPRKELKYEATRFRHLRPQKELEKIIRSYGVDLAPCFM